MNNCPKCGSLISATLSDKGNVVTVVYECGSQVMYSKLYDYYEVQKPCNK